MELASKSIGKGIRIFISLYRLKERYSQVGLLWQVGWGCRTKERDDEKKKGVGTTKTWVGMPIVFQAQNKLKVQGQARTYYECWEPIIWQKWILF